MVKRSSIFGMNILAVFPFASNGSFGVWAATIVLATMTRTASKFFRIVMRRRQLCPLTSDNDDSDDNDDNDDSDAADSKSYLAARSP